MAGRGRRATTIRFLTVSGLVPDELVEVTAVGYFAERASARSRTSRWPASRSAARGVDRIFLGPGAGWPGPAGLNSAAANLVSDSKRTGSARVTSAGITVAAPLAAGGPRGARGPGPVQGAGSELRQLGVGRADPVLDRTEIDQDIVRFRTDDAAKTVPIMGDQVVYREFLDGLGCGLRLAERASGYGAPCHGAGWFLIMTSMRPAAR